MKKHFKDIINRHLFKSNTYLTCCMLWAVSIFVLSVIPPTGEEALNAGNKAHGIAYFVLAFLTALYLIIKKVDSPFIKTVLFSGCYGVFIEAVQFLIPYRFFSLSDILINFAASSMGAAFIWMFVYRTPFFENLYKKK